MLNYRFGDGFEQDGKVFYPIEKKWEVGGIISEFAYDY